jgi:trimethylamine--corrinoid protein Co-methyltransferase
MAFDFGKAVIDNEIGLMIKRVAGGVSTDAESLALDVIAQVGPGGMFLDQPHTLRHMRSGMVLTQIADRQSRRQWAAAGGLDAHARALRRVHEILAQDNPAVLSPEVDARIQAAFQDAVSAKAEPI